MSVQTSVSWQPDAEPREVPDLRLVAASRQPVGMGWIIALVALSAALLVGVFWRANSMGHAARDLQREVDMVEQSGVQAQTAALRSKLSIYRNLQRHLQEKPEAIEVLRQLSLRLPLSVWLDRIEYDRDAGALQVSGWAISRVAAEDMVARLQMAENLFREVRLWETRPATYRGQRVYQMRLQAELVGA